MKNLFKRILSLALVFVCVLAVSVPAFATDYNDFSTAKFNVTFNGKTVTIMNKGKSTAYKTLKKKWGSPKTKTVNGRKSFTFKKGKSTITGCIYTKKVDGYDGYSLSIEAKDKNVKINGVYVGMKKATALKSLKKSFGKSYVKDNTSDKCIEVWYGGFMPIEFFYNSKGKITKLYFFHS